MVIQLESRIEEAGCLVKPLGLWEIIFCQEQILLGSIKQHITK